MEYMTSAYYLLLEDNHWGGFYAMHPNNTSLIALQMPTSSWQFLT